MYNDMHLSLWYDFNTWLSYTATIYILKTLIYWDFYKKTSFILENPLN